MNQRKTPSIQTAMKPVLTVVLSANLPVTVFCALAGLGHGLMNGMVTSRMNRFFSAMADWLDYPEAGSNELIWSLILFAGVVILNYVFIAFQNGGIEVLTFRVTRRLYERLQDCFPQVDPLCLETPSFLNQAEMAEKGIEDIAFLWNVVLVTATSQVPYYIYMVVFMGRLDPVFVVVIFLVFLPVAFSQILRLKLYADFNDESIVLERRYKGYEACIQDRAYFKETRLLGAFPFFNDRIARTIRLRNEKKWKTEKKTGGYELMLKAITLAGYFSVMCLFFHSLMGGRIPVSAFAALTASLHAMFSTMEQMVCQYIGRISETMGNVRAYAGMLNRFGKGAENSRDEDTVQAGSGVGIELERVSFRYPESETYALREVDLRIEAGTCVAIVGANGAGKSTLAKVLTGLYRPTEGRMKANGQEMGSTVGLASHTSAVFQNFQKYALSLAQNVAISDTEKAPDSGQIEGCLEQAGITPEKYPDGLDTVLSSEYGGIDLSGGEWQKTAIARGMYRDCQLLVLDEPTAAIDPLEEAKLYRLFQYMAAGKTTVLVTHRLAAARIADRILVMEDGQVVEDGSHEELLAKKGIYAELFEQQRSMAG